MTPYETAKLLDVENNFAFQPHRRAVFSNGANDSAGWAQTPLLTFCNCYGSVFCAARGVRLPPDKANKQYLHCVAHPDEWEQVSAQKAHELVNSDPNATVLAIAPHAEHGHIAALVESPESDPAGVYVSAAGLRCYVRARLEQSFGPLQPAFFAHKPQE